MAFGPSTALGRVTSVGLTLRETRNGGAVAGVAGVSLTAAGCTLADWRKETFGSAREGGAMVTCTWTGSSSTTSPFKNSTNVN
jgi:hypothetical protein